MHRFIYTEEKRKYFYLREVYRGFYNPRYCAAVLLCITYKSITYLMTMRRWCGDDDSVSSRAVLRLIKSKQGTWKGAAE